MPGLVFPTFAVNPPEKVLVGVAPTFFPGILLLLDDSTLTGRLKTKCTSMV